MGGGGGGVRKDILCPFPTSDLCCFSTVQNYSNNDMYPLFLSNQ